MTERINVASRTLFNHIHAVLALLFWIIIGICMRYYSNITILIGLIVGIIRIFMINDKYAWQVATIEEIRDIKSMLESMDLNQNMDSSDSSNTEHYKTQEENQLEIEKQKKDDEERIKNLEKFKEAKNFVFSDHEEIIKNFKSTQELLKYLEELNIQDSYFQNDVIKKIREKAEIERIYGNNLNSAIAELRKLTSFDV